MATLKRDKILLTKSIKEFLLEIIAEEFALYIKTKTAFWNFEYNRPSRKSNVFELQYIEINNLIDTIGRRIKDIESEIFLPKKIDLQINSFHSDIILKSDTIESLMKNNNKIIEKLKERKIIDTASTDFGTKVLYHNLILKHECIVERLNRYYEIIPQNV